MVINVGINGFGRIGRVILRTCLQNKELQVSAINDPAIATDYICYLIKFDSTHGKFINDVTHVDDQIIVNGQTIKVYHEKVPSSIPWHEVDVQYVIEASGLFTNMEKASGHLASGSVKRVMVTSPSGDMPMIVLGVNCKKLKPEHKLVSCTSSTMYCLAPIMKVLEDNYGVSEGFITCIHAMTPSLKPLDGLCLKGKHWRDYRSIHQNIIPANTGACKALGKIIPSLKDKTSGMAFRVPIVNVSVLDITVRLIKSTTTSNIYKAVKRASKTTLKSIIKLSTEETVSSDFIGEDHSCILDTTSSLQMNPNFFKLVCWYENEYSYSCRVINTIFFSEYQYQAANLTPECTKLLVTEYDISCKSHTSNKITCNTYSEDKIQPKPTPLKPVTSNMPVRSPTLAGPFSPKRKEISKICSNSDSIKSHNIGSDSSDTANENVEPSSLTKARLELVKKEFNKMISITEDLLKKTQSNKLRVKELENNGALKLSTNESDGKFRMSHGKQESAFNKSEQSEKQFKTIFNFDVSEDCSTSTIDSQIRNVNCSQEIISTYSTVEIGQSEVYGKSEITDGSKSSFAVSEIPKINNIEVNTSVKDAKIYEVKKEHVQSKETVTNKSNDKLIDKLGNNRSLSYKDENNGKFRGLDQQVSQGSLGKSIFSVSNSSHLKQECNNNVKSQPVKQAANKNAQLFSRNCVTSVMCGDAKIKTSEIRQDNNEIDDKHQDRKKIFSRELLYERIKTKSTLSIANTQLAKSFNCGVNAVFVTPKHFKTPNLISSINDLKARLDKDALFDKLDSVSNSGSESSILKFETKSQVINLIDLAASLDDLDRLDKICRIIEVSDELSDKLLDKLKSNNGSGQAKKWSFKDLCQKINLDEFGNKLHEKQGECTRD